MQLKKYASDYIARLMAHVVTYLIQKSSLESTVKTLKTKTEKLERLCRAMQGERTKLREEIKAVSVLDNYS